MVKSKNTRKKIIEENKKVDSLWRKPITLDSFEDEDPLATLYQGKEDHSKSDKTGKSAQKRKVKTSSKNVKKLKNAGTPKVTLTNSQQVSKPKKNENEKKNNKSKSVQNTKVSEDELKGLLKIKSDSFQFTDIREILRGKSLDIYAYLRLLSVDTGICKIKHNDLMKILDISRPTLFKQGYWLETLSLIEKSSVPGDHLGTSYKVNRLEDTLPISDKLVEQVESYINTFRQM